MEQSVPPLRNLPLHYMLRSALSEHSGKSPSWSLEQQSSSPHTCRDEAKIEKGDIQFIPGNIELSILQYPDIEIKYVGGRALQVYFAFSRSVSNHA